MSRQALLWLAITATPLGCSVRPGLANAPVLGAVPPGNGRQHDVIANGHDSCERLGAGSPLRGRLPPCGSDRSAGPSAAAPSSDAWPPKANATESLHVRWSQCSGFDLLEASSTVRDAVAVRAFFSRRLWSTTCVDWTRGSSNEVR